MTAISTPGFDDDLIGKRLLFQVEREIAADHASDLSFHVTVCRAGNETVATRIVGSIAPGGARVLWARHACRLLNRQAREGGTWIVVWCEPRNRVDREPTRLLVLWKDRDGDVPVTFDSVQPFEEIVAWGPTWFLDAAARALAAWREHDRDVGVRPQDTIKEALGQASANLQAGGPAEV